MLGGASKGLQERIIISAHQGEVMHRQKALKPVQYYLRQMKKAAPATGDATVLLSADERAQLRKMRKG